MAEEEIGYIQQQRRNVWFDEECRNVVKEGKDIRKQLLQTPGNEQLREQERQKRRESNTLIRRKKRQSLNKELEEIDKDRREGKIRRHYQGIR